MLLKFGPTFVWTFVNLIFLFVVLRWLLFGKVTQFMENRTQTIQGAIENAEQSKQEAGVLKKKYEEQLKAAKGEVEAILAEARTKANKEYDAILANAKKDAEAVMTKARQETERERAEMVKALKGQVATLALAAASKVIEANMDTDSNRKLVNKFIDEAGAA